MSIAIISLCSAYLLLLLNLGGAYLWALPVLGLSSGVALFFTVFQARPQRFLDGQDMVLRGLASLLWAAWLSWLAFQAWIPLSPGWLGAHSPEAFALKTRAAQAGIAVPFTLSVASGPAAREFLISLSLVAVYFACREIARDSQRLRILLWGLLGITVVEAVYGIWAYLSGEYIPALQSKVMTSTTAHGTLANRNHFAGLLNLGTGICLALILASKRERPSWHSALRRLTDPQFAKLILLRVLLLTLVLGTVLSQSRMGNTSLAIALAGAAVLWMLQARSLRNVAGAVLLFLSIAVLDVVLIGSQFGLEKVQQRISETDLGTDARAELNKANLAAAQKYYQLGAGLGSYPYVIQVERAASTKSRAIHAHNDYFEFLIEVGLPGMALLLSLTGLHGLIALKLAFGVRNSKRHLGLLYLFCATCAAVHATTEFNFRLPAYAFIFVAIMGIVAGSLGRTRPNRRGRRPDRAPESVAES